MLGKVHRAAFKPVGRPVADEAACWATLTFPNRATNKRLTCCSAAESDAIKVLLVWPRRGFLHTSVLYSPLIFIVCILEGSRLVMQSFSVSSGSAASLGVLSLFLTAVPQQVQNELPDIADMCLILNV